MSEEKRELLLDLLTKKAVYGLDEAEQRSLDELGDGDALEFDSLETTAAAISMVGLDAGEPLPAHLRSRIVDDAESFLAADAATPESSESPPPAKPVYESLDRPGGSFFSWLGWLAAAAACIALALNLWFTRAAPTGEIAGKQPTPIPIESPRTPSPAEMREKMIQSTGRVTRANWAAGNIKEIKQVTGDIVWSDEKQMGYMLFRGLPANDRATETYQLWIFDKSRDKYPIDGGTFDVPADGEIVIPISAKLNARSPEMFAVTVEKPGGVVVSAKEKIAALAKVETPAS